jgi:hypothetical protein
MKSIGTLLLVLLFASCGKQDVYEFEISEEHTEFDRYDKNISKWISSGETNWMNKTNVPEYLVPSVLPAETNSSAKLVPPIRPIDILSLGASSPYPSVTMKVNAQIQFYPIDGEEFCFYKIHTYLEEVEYKDEDAEILAEAFGEELVNPKDSPFRILENELEILFFDEYGNNLFSFPFTDSKTFKGKTKDVSRALLERVDDELTKTYFNFFVINSDEQQYFGKDADLKLIENFGK